jgi:hypothetical protein
LSGDVTAEVAEACVRAARWLPLVVCRIGARIDRYLASSAHDLGLGDRRHLLPLRHRDVNQNIAPAVA